MRIQKSTFFKATLPVILLFALPAVAQQPSGSGPSSASGYVLGPDDQLLIRVSEGLDLGDKPTLIGANGNITLPLLGHIPAAGRTVEQFESDLKELLKPYVKEPQVTVTVTEFRSQPVSVFGAVVTPGVIQLRGRKTLFEVLSMAGGPRETAGSSITITRLQENGPIPLPGATPDPTGRFNVAQLGVQDVVEGKNPGVNIEIKAHDVISVSQANSSLVYVVGDVEHAGAFTLGAQRTLSVLSALSRRRVRSHGQAGAGQDLPSRSRRTEAKGHCDQSQTDPDGKGGGCCSAARRRFSCTHE